MTPTSPAAAQAEARPAAPLLLAAYVIALCTPAIFFVGSFRLEPYRIVLILTFFPALIFVLGRMTRADAVMIFYTAWMALTLFVNHGVGSMWQYAGMSVAETLGSYLLARYAIRSAADVAVFARVLFWTILAITPFVAVEALTGDRLLTEIFRRFTATFGISHREVRWGMTRAQGPFEHPILMGVFCASAVSICAFGRLPPARLPMALLRAAPPVISTAFSLSLGAYVAIAIQLGLILFDRIFRTVAKRWIILIGAIVAGLLLFSMVANRSPASIFIQLFSFNSLASWMRIAVWNYGTAAVLGNPLFGIGLNEFSRPGWVTSSVDNFWLLIALRHGLPAVMAILLVAVSSMAAAAALINSGRAEGLIARALFFALVAMVIALCTVAVWNATLSYFMFLIGACQWMVGERRAVAPPLMEADKWPAVDPRGTRLPVPRRASARVGSPPRYP